MVLADADLVQRVDEIAGKITYKHMHDDPEFMKGVSGRRVHSPYESGDAESVIGMQNAECKNEKDKIKGYEIMA